MPDEKPQSEKETDDLAEETYIDAMNLNLVHSVTDIYVPVGNRGLALMARRNLSSSVWNKQSGLHPWEDQVAPFGVMWSSNLGAHLRFVNKMGVTRTSLGRLPDREDYVYVVDENGAEYRFAVIRKFTNHSYPDLDDPALSTKLEFHPLPVHNHEKGVLLTSLEVAEDGFFTFKKKHGTTLRFSPVLSELQVVRPQDRLLRSGSFGNQTYNYARLLRVTDKDGQYLEYSYASVNSTLVPDQVRANGSQTLALTIVRKPGEGIIDKIQDPRGNWTYYRYDSYTGNGSSPFASDERFPPGQSHHNRILRSPDARFDLLRDVRIGASGNAPQVVYGYNAWIEADAHPLAHLNDYIIDHFHINLEEIADGLGNAHTFEYTQDRSRRVGAPSFLWPPPSGSFWLQTGLPRNLTAVNFPARDEGQSSPVRDRSEFTNHSYGMIQVVDAGGGFHAPVYRGYRAASSVDTEGNARIYSFHSNRLVYLNEVRTRFYHVNNKSSQGLLDAFALEVPKVMLFTEMRIHHLEGSDFFINGYDDSSIEVDLNIDGGESTKYLGSERYVFDRFAGLSVKCVEDVYGNVTTFEYDDEFEHDWFESGQHESYLYAYHDDPTSQTNAMGGVRTFSYDPDHRIKNELIDEEDNVWEYVIDSTGRRTRETVRSGSSVIQITHFDYLTEQNDFHRGVLRERRVKSEDIASGDLKITYVPDGFGRIQKEIQDSGGLSLETVYEYDNNGNRTSTIDPAGNRTDFTYDIRNRLIKIEYPATTDPITGQTAPRARQHIVYDAAGRKVGTCDVVGAWTDGGTWREDRQYQVFQYDERGRVVREIQVMGPGTGLDAGDPDTFINYQPFVDASATYGAGESDLVRTFKYNAMNSVVEETDSEGNATNLFYDSFQRLTARQHPEAHVFDPVSNTRSLQRPVEWYQYLWNSGSTAFDISAYKPTLTVDSRGYIEFVQQDRLSRPFVRATQYASPVAIGSHDPTQFPAAARILYENLYMGMDGSSGHDDFLVVRTTYDGVGNPTQETVWKNLGRSALTQTSYDALGRAGLATYADLTTTETTYSSTGLLWKARDQRGHVTEHRYDNAGRLVKTIQPEVHDAETDMPVEPVTEYNYDRNGNRNWVKNPRGEITEYGFDERNRQIWQKLPAAFDYDSMTVKSPVFETAYDSAGNVWRTKNARGNLTTNRYDRANRLTKERLPSVPNKAGILQQPEREFFYDRNGNIVAEVDPEENVTLNSYDLRGLLTKTTNVFSDPAENIAVDFDYDAAGNKVRVSDGENRMTRFLFDGLARNTQVIDDSGEPTVYEYDAINKIRRLDAEGRETLYDEYDALNRLKHVSYVGRSEDNLTYSYDDVGNLLSVLKAGHDGKADVGYTYDALNRIETETSGGLTHEYGYDRSGNRVYVKYGATGREIISDFDALNRLETLVEGSRTTSYRYDGNSNVRLRTLPNGDAVETGYDALNRPILVEATAGGGAPLYSYEQGYDLTGNLHKIEETRTGAIGGRLVVNDYDEANRLWKETVTPVSGPVVTTTYSFDRANNRTEKMVQDGSGTTSTIYGVNDLNQLTGFTEGNRTVSFAYDKAGNRKSQTEGGSTDTYTYDYDNRLVQLGKQVPGPGITTGTYRYIYDYRSRRVERWEDGNRTQSIFSGGTSVMERTVRLVTDPLSDPDGDGYENLLEYAFGLDPLGWGSFSCGCSGYDNWAEIAITQRISPALKESYETPRLDVEFVRGSDIGGGVGGILYSIRGATASYSHHNSRGDIVARTNDVGSLTYQATYEAFGTRTQESGSNPDRQRANSKDEDPTGLLNEGFRYRDLETGVFLTRDPAGFVDGPNLYTYVLQNPWSKFDPEGLSWKAVFYGEFWSQVGNELASNTRAVLIDPIADAGQRAAGHAGKATDAYYEGNTGAIVKHAAAVAGITVVAVAENAPGGRSVKGAKAVADVAADVGRAAARGTEAATDVGQSARRVVEANPMKNAGRQGKQKRLKELADSPNTSNADKGWIKQDMNEIQRGKRKNVRNPPGKDLAHERGREAAKGYDYKYSNLQDRDLHKTQHKYDNYGRKNKERPVRSNEQ